jgi:hypothetical protein
VNTRTPTAQEPSPRDDAGFRDLLPGLDVPGAADRLAGGTDEFVGRQTQGFDRADPILRRFEEAGGLFGDDMAATIGRAAGTAGAFGEQAPTPVEAGIVATERAGELFGVNINTEPAQAANDAIASGGTRAPFDIALEADRAAEALEATAGAVGSGDVGLFETGETAAETAIQIGEELSASAQRRPLETFGQLAGGAAVGGVAGRALGSTRLGSGRTGQALRLTDPDITRLAAGVRRAGSRARREASDFLSDETAQLRADGSGRGRQRGEGSVDSQFDESVAAELRDDALTQAQDQLRRSARAAPKAGSAWGAEQNHSPTTPQREAACLTPTTSCART